MFDINIYCIVFGVNEPLNKKCILSTSKEDIQFPKMVLENLDKINNQITSFLKEFIFVNDLVLIPQIISLHSPLLNEESNKLNIIYGFIVDYNSSIDTSKVQWLDFDPMVEHKFSPIIFETIQKLA